MEIKTKFSVGDKVYYIKDNEICETNVARVEVIRDEKGTSITYKTEDGEFLYEDTNLDIDEMPFASVDELLNYLKNHIR